jgi:hypothetical protein
VTRRFAALLVLLLVACGQEAAGIGQRGSAALGPQVRQVRASASSGDLAGAQRTLAEIRQTVADLRQRGELSDAGASRVLAATAGVEAQLGTVATPTSQGPSSTLGQRDTRATTGTTKKGKGKKDD